MNSVTRDYLYNSFNSLMVSNAKKPLKTWLEMDLDQNLERGEQAFVYTLHSIEFPRLKCVAKISKFISDYTLSNELNILKRLEDARVPNVPRAYGIFQIFVNYDTDHISFRSHGEGYFPAEMLLMEYMHHMMSLSKYLEMAPRDQCMAAVKQVILTLAVAQERASFTHYDLHTFNILISNNTIDKYAIFQVGKEEFRCEKKGIDICLIDFGCSYADCVDPTLFCSLTFTRFGFFIDRYDGGTLDCIRFLYRIVDEINAPALKKVLQREASATKIGICTHKGWLDKEEVHIPDLFHSKIAGQCEASWFLTSSSDWLDNLQIFLSAPLMFWELENEGALLEDCMNYFVAFIRELEEYSTNTMAISFVLRAFCCAINHYLQDFLSPETATIAAQCIEAELQDKLSGLIDNFAIKVNYLEVIPAVIQLGRCYENFAAGEMSRRFEAFRALTARHVKPRCAADFFRSIETL